MSDFVVAVTGGVASGKSEVTRRFAARGIVVADADALAHALVEPGQPALAEITARFGAALLQPDGTLDRRALRARVFADAQARAALEAILHPHIRAGLHAACAAADSAYAIAAIPLLVRPDDAGRDGSATDDVRAAYPWLDRIAVVDVPRATQITRLLRRDGGSLALAEQMLAAQATRAQRLAIADDVIANDGTLDALDAQVTALHARYLRLAGQTRTSSFRPPTPRSS